MQADGYSCAAYLCSKATAYRVKALVPSVQGHKQDTLVVVEDLLGAIAMVNLQQQAINMWYHMLGCESTALIGEQAAEEGCAGGA